MKLITRIAVCIPLALSGCHAPDPSVMAATTRLNPGQSKAEVFAIMGTPATVMSPGDGIELLKYHFYQPRGLMRNTLHTEYVVKLSNGIVIAYGNARDIAPPPAKPVVILSNDKNVNVNIRSDATSATNAPTITPRVNIETN